MKYEDLIRDLEVLGYVKHEANESTNLFGLVPNPKSVIRVITDTHTNSAQEEDELIKNSYANVGFSVDYKKYVVEFTDQEAACEKLKIPIELLKNAKVLALVMCGSMLFTYHGVSENSSVSIYPTS